MYAQTPVADNNEISICLLTTQDGSRGSIVFLDGTGNRKFVGGYGSDPIPRIEPYSTRLRVFISGQTQESIVVYKVKQ